MNAGLGRRVFVSGATALCGGLWTERTRAASAMGFDEARHLLSRTTFGATPAEIRALEVLDYGEAVDRLLGSVRAQAVTSAPAWVNESPAALRRQQQDVNRTRKAEGAEPRPNRVFQEQARELRRWWIEELLVSDQPMVERMTLFWHNHFTSSLQKVRYAPARFRQNALFRREAFGNFARLLKEVARDPAMLLYLDGVRSVASQPNENFARELLELFTLGEGHYSEADIKAAARAFTGRTIDRETGLFRAVPQQHDDGEKTFLGKTGRLDGDAIIDILLAHPRTAETVVEKLWREFVSLKPDRAEIKRLAGLLRHNGYEMKPVLRALFLSPAFRDPAYRGALIKSPVELVVGSVHLLGLPVPEKTGLLRMMQGLGQVPLDPPNVKGWPGGESWITTHTLLLRQQFMRRMIEATTVSLMEGGMTMNRRMQRREQMPAADDKVQMMETRPVEGRSLRNAGSEVRLGPTLTGIVAQTLLRTLLPRQPIDAIDGDRSAGAIVAAAMLDTAYQLK
jgi:uncharacterized protein (DUF1800 family)